MTWADLPDTTYSVGYLNVNHSTFHIEARDPMFVRLDGIGYPGVYAFTAGYSKRTTPNATSAELRRTFELHCQAKDWMVTLDLSTMTIKASDVSNIYMGEDRSRCTGKLQGDVLIFNISYDQCGTTFEVGNDKLTYRNKILYKTDVMKEGVQWEQSIQCTSSSHKTGSLHIGMTNHNSVSLSSQIEEKLFDISLYTDRSLHKELLTTSNLTAGTEVFVKVSTPVSASLFIVNECDMVLGNNRGKHGSIPLIKDGCAVTNGTTVLSMRNEMTLFKFEMFDLGDGQTGAYVTCDVTFCDKMNFSPKCDQRCHNSISPVLIG